MSQVSRRKMNESVEQKVFSLFSEVLVSLSKREEVESFLTDLLSPTERTMLAKRLTVALLLARGYSYEEICDILKVSRDTIGKISLWSKRGGQGFDIAISKITTKEKRQEFLLDLEKLVAKLIAPHPISQRKADYYYEQRKRNLKAW